MKREEILEHVAEELKDLIDRMENSRTYGISNPAANSKSRNAHILSSATNRIVDMLYGMGVLETEDFKVERDSE